MIHAFYSDPHFGHANVIDYAGRPFSSVAEMDQALIDRYNAVVPSEALTIWCGDAFFHTVERSREILNSLNGQKILVRGNHDGSTSRMLSIGFDVVVNELAVRIGGVTATVSHYPYADTAANRIRRNGNLDVRYPERRPKPMPDRVLIHGHTHAKRQQFNNQFHVGVDAWNYAPVLFEDLESLVLQWRKNSQ
jgi:calcineurin-like phosphoesterase family protein